MALHLCPELRPRSAARARIETYAAAPPQRVAWLDAFVGENHDLQEAFARTAYSPTRVISIRRTRRSRARAGGGRPGGGESRGDRRDRLADSETGFHGLEPDRDGRPESFENISTVGVESALNMLPQFQPAGTQFDDTDVQASAFNSPGISSVNLRGLGPNRNLVLVNGRRAQPANATLVVDVNSIPSAAIQNVEVITGGASAVYGADAIGGVVNFILKDDFEGLSIDMQTSSTFEGDGEET